MRYVSAKIKEQDKVEAYRIYTADAVGTMCGAKIKYSALIYGNLHDFVPEDANDIKNRLKNKINSMTEE